MTATVPSMIGQFNMENIKLLLEMDYEVHVACNFEDRSVWTEERVSEFKKQLTNMGVKKIQIEYARTPYDILKLIRSYSELRKLIQREKYTCLHCHTPVAGMIARLAAKGTETKVIYTAHGFHFYKGAPLQNWLLYYPVEKWLSRYTDVLITINKEDYQRAKEKFHAKETKYIPGVGVNTARFTACKVDKMQKRKELGVNMDDFLLLSVGELSERKNQRIIIDALRVMKEDGSIGKIIYLAVGQGYMQKTFEELIKKYRIEDHVQLLGFRTDIDELCKVADCFVHPSIREGLGIAPLEAMAAGLPLISASVNGIKDYTEDGVSGCCINPMDVDQMINAIKKMRNNDNFRSECGFNNIISAKKFDIKNTEKIMKKLYGEFMHRR